MQRSYDVEVVKLVTNTWESISANTPDEAAVIVEGLEEDKESPTRSDIEIQSIEAMPSDEAE